ncbi:protein ycf20 [Porphyridium purpureum]|uniref:Uncharacterized protein ycf20 n=1 Tax=Porphyridium purpureum TaxID=35688 RepID=A0A5J4YS45_PORPP|nr:protein ycf20 [Porphyridium purpureum]|eukprot:POR3781..scf229_5
MRVAWAERYLRAGLVGSAAQLRGENNRSASIWRGRRAAQTARRRRRHLHVVYEIDADTTSNIDSVHLTRTRASQLVRLLLRVWSICNAYLLRSLRRQILWGAIALCLGNFCASVLITIIGEVRDWDAVAAALVLLWIETLTKWFYSSPARSRRPLAKIFNAFRVGITYGFIFDATRMSSKY